MEIELGLQYNKQLTKSTGVAIVLPEVVNIDLLTSAVSLATALQEQGKTASIISGAKQLPKLAFFPQLPQIHKSINATNELLVHVSNQNVKPESVRYETTPDGLQIYVKPEQGEKKHFVAEDVNISPAGINYDLLIILGAANFEELGQVYKENPQLFFNTTKIAISNRADHEYFAAVNIIDTQAAALSELVYELVLPSPELLKHDLITTGLLAGIISQTQSFRNSKTTPETLAKAARLVDAGARQQDIIQHLYKTKSFSLLQLWGRAMARIKSFPEHSLLFSVLTQQDFTKTKTNPNMISEVASELAEMADGYSVIALGAELPKGVQLLITGLPHVKLKKTAQKFSSSVLSDPEPLVGNYRYAEITLPNLELAQVESLLKQHLPKL